MLTFNGNSHLTLGVEIELQLINPDSYDMNPVAQELFARTAGHPKIKPESFLSMAEINTGICSNVQEVEKDMAESIAIFRQAAADIGALVSTTGTHPFARYSERIPYPSDRYRYLIDRNQWIMRRLLICGLHVHLGMRDGDTCMRFNNFFLHMIPHLLALTASSPFWQGEDTGLASCRSTIFESCPTAGHPNRLHSWAEFSDLCNSLIKCKAISSHKDLWWDLRPSPDFGTLEIRICDGLASFSETLAIVALIHALAHWYETHAEYNADLRAPFMWMMRENKWRATRHGLEADIITNEKADLIPVREDIRAWIVQLQPQVKKLGYDGYFNGMEPILSQGSSHMRQRAVFAKTNSLVEVAKHNIREFETGAPIYV